MLSPAEAHRLPVDGTLLIWRNLIANLIGPTPQQFDLPAELSRSLNDLTPALAVSLIWPIVAAKMPTLSPFWAAQEFPKRLPDSPRRGTR